MKTRCDVCCHQCVLDEGQTGACGARRNVRGTVIASNYGRLTSLALDPIEKKPLARFHPGSKILSVGSYGCSLRCPFCQNYQIASAREKSVPGARDKEIASAREKSVPGARGKEIASAREKSVPGARGKEIASAREKSVPGAQGGVFSDDNNPSGGTCAPAPVTYREGNRERILDTAVYTPEELCALALDLRERGNIGIAFTYNEPLVGWEFVRDTARLFHEQGMRTVMVSNGMASRKVLRELLPYIDAMNIDLKGFTEGFYRDFLGGDLEMVKDFIAEAAEECHMELTKLIIPDHNDSESEMREMTAWIASLCGGRGREIPLHVSRYFPRYKWNAPPTRVDTVYRLAQAARETLKYVYTGNC